MDIEYISSFQCGGGDSKIISHLRSGNICEAYIQCILTDNLSLIKYFHDHRVDMTCIEEENNKIYIKATSAMLRCIIDDMKMKSMRYHQCLFLINICKNNRLDVIDYLLDSLGDGIFSTLKYKEAIETSLKNGNYDMFKYLYTKLSSDKMVEYAFDMCLICCLQCNLSTLTYLMDDVMLDIDQEQLDQLLRTSCMVMNSENIISHLLTRGCN